MRTSDGRNDRWFRNSLFWKKVLNNKSVSVLFVLLLVFLDILLFTRISYLFEPVVIVFRIIGPPVIVAGIFYYLLNPLVDILEEKGISRTLSIILLLLLLVLLLVLGGWLILPILQKQFLSFLENWPSYWETIVTEVDGLTKNQYLSDLTASLGQTDLLQTLSEYSTKLLNAALGGLTNVIGTVTQLFIVLFTMPFILYYLLKDGKQLPEHILPFIPIKMRKKVTEVGVEAHTQLSQYIRGQLLVAFFVGLIFWISFTVIKLDYALFLGVLAGCLNLIPYLGSILATIPALIIGLVHSPFMLLKVLLVFGIEQLIEGRVLSPQIIGSNLNIHPVTIIFILLVAGRLFGVTGVILGIPGYAVLKIILSHLFSWYSESSGLYEGDIVSSESVEESK